MSISGSIQKQDRITVEILFVVALKEELDTLAEIFSDYSRDIRFDEQIVYSHKLKRIQGDPLQCMTLLIDDQGPEKAAIATSRALAGILPSLVINVGISGRLEPDFGLGDVLFATLVDNPFYRAKVKNGDVSLAGESYPLKRLTEPLFDAIRHSPPMYSFGAKIRGGVAEKMRASGLIHSVPTTRKGPICATNAVVDDAPFSQGLRSRRNRLLTATDMESAAVVTTCWEHGITDDRILVVRGLSDPADGRKREVDLVDSGEIRLIAMKNASLLIAHATNFLWFMHGSVRVQQAEKHDDGTLASRRVVSMLNQLATDISSGSNPDVVCKAIRDRLETDPTLALQVLELSRSAYDSQINKQAGVHETALLSVAAAAQDYLVARFVMSSVIPNGMAREIGRFDPLANVYPQRINRFCKAILSTARDEQKVVDQLEEAYRSSNRTSSQKSRSKPSTGARKKAHVCYLLGRLSDDQQRGRAVSLLSGWLKDLESNPRGEQRKSTSPLRTTDDAAYPLQKVFRSLEDASQRMLLRTILISLVLLDQHQWASVYVRTCLRNKKFDELNRGFHLEYYGDIPFDPREMMSHKDNLKSCAESYQMLIEKLERSFYARTTYPLRDVELQTLVSLCQQRHAIGTLADEMRVRLCRLLAIVAESDFSSVAQLRSFILMAADHLSRPFRPAQLIADIYQLKRIRRAGWNAPGSGRTVAYPESVMDHIGGGLMLIHFGVPEVLSLADKQALGGDAASQFSKNEIVRMFLVHDIAEAYTGDLLPSQRNDVTRSSEDMTMSKIDNFSTYDGFHAVGTYTRWKDFEHALSINGKIAREIDALENLQQLLIENAMPGNIIPDYEEWKRELVGRVSTTIGIGILNTILPKVPTYPRRSDAGSRSDS